MKLKIIIFILLTTFVFSETQLPKPESMFTIVSNGKIDSKILELTTIHSYKTTGLGLFCGNVLLGKVYKNELDYPQKEFGLNHWLGFSHTWILNNPTQSEIKKAVTSVYSQNNSYKLNKNEIKLQIKKELNHNIVNYVSIGTALLIIPANLEYGWMFLSKDGDTRTRIGFGLPTIISVGVNFDF
ncbi:MAG: hypothetical protein B6I28_02520 [Fusobacteriia bacterium 4572_132]|nr:MAG: hypothetical protein B6I28_02520 [Fusobacteriia bacterium 4572_132]